MQMITIQMTLIGFIHRHLVPRFHASACWNRLPIRQRRKIGIA